MNDDLLRVITMRYYSLMERYEPLLWNDPLEQITTAFLPLGKSDKVILSNLNAELLRAFPTYSAKDIIECLAALKGLRDYWHHSFLVRFAYAVAALVPYSPGRTPKEALDLCSFVDVADLEVVARKLAKHFLDARFNAYASVDALIFALLSVLCEQTRLGNYTSENELLLSELEQAGECLSRLRWCDVLEEDFGEGTLKGHRRGIALKPTVQWAQHVGGDDLDALQDAVLYALHVTFPERMFYSFRSVVRELGKDDAQSRAGDCFAAAEDLKFCREAERFRIAFELVGFGLLARTDPLPKIGLGPKPLYTFLDHCADLRRNTPPRADWPMEFFKL